MDIAKNILFTVQSPIKTLVERVPPIWLYLASLAVALILPAVSNDAFLFRILTMIAIWSILALGQNIITGFCGQLSFGQAAFYGIGAYTSVLLTIHFGLPYPLALIASAVVAGFFGLLVGYPAIRIGGDYLFLVTIGFSEIMRLVFLNWDGLTGGAIGIPNVPTIDLFGYQFYTNKDYYLFSVFLLAVIVLGLSRIINSDIGRSFKAIREDEVAAKAVGISVARYKMLAFGLGASLGGVAGSLVAHFLAYVGPDMFTNWESNMAFIIMLLGGMGSIPGTIIGAALLIGTFESARGLVDYRLYIAGGILLAIVLIKPSGIMGSVKLRTPGPPPADPSDEASASQSHPTSIA